MNYKKRILILLIALSTTISPIVSTAIEPELSKSVVKIYSAIQRPDYSLPWQNYRPQRSHGSGFIIQKNRILSNAHVVSDSKFLQVQKKGDPRRYSAEVIFSAHDCDLAVIEVKDKSFFDDTKPVNFASKLPMLNDEVLVIGYPMGGDRLSVTKGIVSRIDYSVYAHSGIDQHLVLQVDAAINPGNSGGPVIFKDDVIGLAFQSLAWGENIGYVIPVPVINRFLADIEDGNYDGYPEMGIGFLNTRNPALRKYLNLPATETGVVIYSIDPFGSAEGHLKPGDVITGIDGYSINSDGHIEMENNQILFIELLERKQRGESVRLDLIRHGKIEKKTIPLSARIDFFAFRILYNQLPEYFMHGGLVFTPLTRNYAHNAATGKLDSNEQQLIYFMENAKKDKLYKGYEEFVVLSRRLPHPVNTYADKFVEGIVSEINGINIANLADIRNAFKAPTDGFHIIKFTGMNDFLVLEAKATEKATEIIAQRYGIPENSNIVDNK